MIKKELCPLCGNKLIFFEKRSNIKLQPTDVMLCKDCLIMVNSDANEEDIILQKEGLENVYFFDTLEIESVHKEFENQVHLIKSVLEIAKIDPTNKSFFELGYGKGLSLFAARKLGFEKVTGVDLSTDIIKKLNLIFNDGKIVVYEDISSVETNSIDCIYLWHTLEHINDPLSLFSEFNRISNTDCKILIQIPQCKREYIIDAHHYFYTETSIRKLFELYDFQIDKILYDLKNEFITVFGSKSTFFK